MTLRGDINAVLNRLVREGVISAFETNLGARAEPHGVRVIVTPTSASNREVVRRTVADALSAQAEHITVTVKPG